MKTYLNIGFLVLILLAMAVSVFAMPIPGSTNELVNGDFQYDWSSWEHGDGLAMTAAGSYGNAVYCNGPFKSLLLRQVVLNPLWDGGLNQQQIDLVADVMCDWQEGLPDAPLSTISFKIGWWGPELNNLQTAPAGLAEVWSQSVTYGFSSAGKGMWDTVNPFIQDTAVLQWSNKPFQPKWLSVEMLISQAPAETVWVDNVILTGKGIPPIVGAVQVPEPMSLMLGFMGLGSVVGLRRFVKK